MGTFNSLKVKAARFLLAASRLRVAKPFVKLFFNRMIRWLPLDRIMENDHWTAIFHPKPEYPLHIIILPKMSIESMMAMPVDDLAFNADLFRIVKDLVIEYHLSDKGYRLITNGGPNQTIPQWHWHLISDEKID